MSVRHRTKPLQARQNLLFTVAIAVVVAVAALLVLVFAGFNVIQGPATAQTIPNSPRDVHQAFATAFNARDLEGMLDLYEPDAAVVPEPGKVVTGSDDLRAAMEGYLALPGKIRIETVFVIEAGEIALTRSRWEVRERGEITASSSGAEVMRRGQDGVWRLVIDNPYGGNTAK